MGCTIVFIVRIFFDKKMFRFATVTTYESFQSNYRPIIDKLSMRGDEDRELSGDLLR